MVIIWVTTTCYQPLSIAFASFIILVYLLCPLRSDHPDSASKPLSDWKSDERLTGPVDRKLTVKPGPLTVDTTEHSFHSHQNQHLSHLVSDRRGLSMGIRDMDSHISMGPTHTYADEYHIHGHLEPTSCPLKSESLVPTSRPDLGGLMQREQDCDENVVTPQVATVETGDPPTSISNWYGSTKLEYPSSKLSETYSSAHVSDDYLDSQSLAPHVSSSTVSPSSLGKFFVHISLLDRIFTCLLAVFHKAKCEKP